jgi:hypothetical protein
MAIYSYKITRDYGFAPNPFHNLCTLATCKPRIRNNANIGDWVLGFNSMKKGIANPGKLIYAMQIEVKLSFDQYWESYKCKRPVMNGSQKQKYGDNIYHHDELGEWIQEDSHHKNEDGTVNLSNLNRDTRVACVLIASEYWYWGESIIEIPEFILLLRPNNRDYKVNPDIGIEQELGIWLRHLPDHGYIGKPKKFSKGFERYDGQ